MFCVLSIYLIIISANSIRSVKYESPFHVTEFIPEDPVVLSKNTTKLYFPYVKGNIPKNTFWYLSEAREIKISFKVMSIEPSAFSKLENLETLDLSWNIIKLLENETFFGLINLKLLNLEGNKISYIHSGTFASLESLEILNLNFNLKLKTLQDDVFYGLISLERLNLNYCDISTIEEHAFSGLTVLKILNLDHNKLKEIPTSILDTCSSIEELHISSNKIKTIEEKIFASFLRRLKLMDISKNPVICDFSEETHNNRINLSIISSKHRTSVIMNCY